GCGGVAGLCGTGGSACGGGQDGFAGAGMTFNQWFPVALASTALLGSFVIPVVQVLRRRRVRRRRRNGQCVFCGYPVEPPTYYCPECGKSSKPESPAARLFEDSPPS